MSNKTWPDGYGNIVLQETDSTMAETRRRLDELSGPTWLLARHQTAATGRRGRPWSMPAGNFAATLFLPLPQETPATAALRSFVTSLALHQALSDYVAADRLSLKWPNDVLLDGGKLAGILLESHSSAQGLAALSIGIGINLASAPSTGDVEPGAFRPVALGVQVSPEDMLTGLANAYASVEQRFIQFGFDPIRRAWLSHAARLGDVITARTTRDEITGTFETVDADGNLVLRTPRGPVAIPAGNVFF